MAVVRQFLDRFELLPFLSRKIRLSPREFSSVYHSCEENKPQLRSESLSKEGDSIYARSWLCTLQIYLRTISAWDQCIAAGKHHTHELQAQEFSSVNKSHSPHEKILLVTDALPNHRMPESIVKTLIGGLTLLRYDLRYHQNNLNMQRNSHASRSLNDYALFA